MDDYKPKKKMPALIQSILAVLIIYGGYCCLIFLFQRTILFPRHQIPVPPSPKESKPGWESLWLETSVGRVEAWFLPPGGDSPIQPSPAVIFAHGNAELIDFWPQQLRPFTSMGVGVLLVEYPGYGRSAGTPSQKNITETFVAAYDNLVDRHDVDPSRIVLWGRSLGGGAVCALAEKRPSAALVLMSTFTDVRSCAAKLLAPGFLVRDPFDNLQVVRSYAGPILIVHGRHDTLIPYDHGQKLYRAARHGKMLTYDCRHNDCPPNWKTFWQDLASFLMSAKIVEMETEDRFLETGKRSTENGGRRHGN